MGYISYARSQKEVVNDILLDIERSERYDLLGKSKYGTQLWIVLHDKEKDLKFLSLFKLAKIGDRFGYKVIDEICHPYYYNCGLKLLKLTNSGENLEWREKVIELSKK